jgi:hypothetical protein
MAKDALDNTASWLSRRQQGMSAPRARPVVIRRFAVVTLTEGPGTGTAMPAGKPTGPQGL